ncbi:ABC transporter permease [Thalassorhabdomicrobium marinisediminis]|uniref:ABC transporter permease n=1 Tax=Thalassorhabdomicrobium marinisediminis TaxID=2170577 RepID=A0A2T7FWU2_9RHOB|nr:MlaE family lipid ABC transporter permease subunit [Thalassorhabdomicrobium marinisediminis]PVA06643.1 ABC transporter permease [Thalassorhabdomicrobium marinisediminis]
MNDRAAPLMDLETTGSGLCLRLRGPQTVANARALAAKLDQQPDSGAVELDLTEVGRLDTAAAFVLVSFRDRREQAGQEVTFTGLRAGHQSLLDTVARSLPSPTTEPKTPFTFTDALARVGEVIAGGVKFILALLGFLGLFLARLARTLRHPSEFRFTSLVHHAGAVGLGAVPIVALMAFLIGVVLAFQGSTQLRQFGAEVFVVDLIAISILRELGILLTSIIVAGRTASSYTAAIGSMKMHEEIDAMRGLGLDPATVLFVPRILALVITLPILGLVANVMGLLGGGLMAWIDLGISPAMFITRLVNGTDINHVIIGLVKAPVFALIIGLIGCHAGMQVRGNAESLGRMTSSAVVRAIFAVIVADAAFSIFFAQIGM